jgi:hypothetical protein
MLYLITTPIQDGLLLFLTQIEGQPTTGKLVESVGDFESVKIEGVMKSPEHKVVVGTKQRCVVVLSNNRFSQDNSCEYIYVAPIMSVHEKRIEERNGMEG